MSSRVESWACTNLPFLDTMWETSLSMGEDIGNVVYSGIEPLVGIKKFVSWPFNVGLVPSSKGVI